MGAGAVATTRQRTEEGDKPTARLSGRRQRGTAFQAGDAMRCLPVSEAQAKEGGLPSFLRGGGEERPLRVRSVARGGRVGRGKPPIHVA